MFDRAVPVEDVPPAVVVLAKEGPGDVNRALADATITGINVGSLVDQRGAQAFHLADMATVARPSQQEQAAANAVAAQKNYADALQISQGFAPTSRRANQLSTAQLRLGRGAALLAFLPGAVLGVGAVQGLFMQLQQAGGNITGDKSILPGDKPPLVPGISDVASVPYEITITAPGLATIRASVATRQQAGAPNDYSRDFELVGTEATQDEVVASKLIGLVTEHGGVITDAAVTGYSSDEINEPGANLGKSDTRNQQLAEARAGVGRDVLLQLAKEHGIEVGTVAINGREAILTAKQIDSIDKLATSLHTTRQELLAAYDNGLPVGPEAQQLLHTLLDESRGVTYSITIRYDTQKTEPTVTQHTETEYSLFIPGEIFALITGGGLGMLTMAFGHNQTRARLARFRARRIVKQALRS